MSKGGCCKGWKLEGGLEGGVVLGRRRGSRKRPSERTKTKVILQTTNSKGHAQGGLCFSLKPGPPAPKIRRATPLGSVTSSAALTERAYVKGWPHGDPIRGPGLIKMGREKKVSLSLLLQPCFREQLRAECLDRGSLPSLGYK